MGVHEPVPAAIDPEPILRGLEAEGFFVWSANRTLPMGTLSRTKLSAKWIGTKPIQESFTAKELSMSFKAPDQRKVDRPCIPIALAIGRNTLRIDRSWRPRGRFFHNTNANFTIKSSFV